MSWNITTRGRTVAGRAALTTVMVAFGLALAVAQDVRTWTDSTGKFSIEAKYVSTADGKVTLEQADGSNLEIELKKLSAADQFYVSQQQQAEAANPFKKKEAPSPFQPKTATKPAGAAMPSASAAPGAEPRTVKVDWSNSSVIALTPTSTEWKVPAPTAPAPAAATAPAKPRPVPLPPKANFFEGVKALIVNADGTRAVVGYAGGNPGKEGATRLVLCDLTTGKMLGQGAILGAFLPLALSDDGLQVLVRSDEWGGGKHDRLELWALGRTGLNKLVECVPYEGDDDNQRDIRWAAFLDAERFATINEGGKLALWRLDSFQPTAHLQAAGGSTPALSPDRSLLAFNTGNEIGVLDAAAAEVLALQTAPMTNMAWTTMSFSPNGQRLGCQVFVSKLFVYNLADGALFREIPLSGVNAQGPLVWPDADHVLIGGRHLIDLESQVRLWDYNGAEQAAESGGLVWFVVTPMNQQGGLVPARLPQPGVEQALKKALADPNFFILKPGGAVSIDVNGIPDAAQRNTVVQGLTANLAKNNVRVAPNSPLVVQASVAPGKEEEISYRTIGMGFRVDTFKIRPQIGSIRFVHQGKVAWETSASTVPFFDMAHLEKDESLADHVRKFEKPNYAYFAQVELPKLLTRPSGPNGGQAALGTSQVSLAGVR